MAGLIGNALASRSPEQQAPNQMQVGGQPPMDAEDDDQPNVTPEEQALYDKTVTNAIGIIYSEATSNKIIEMVRDSEPKTDGVAQAAVTITDQLYQKAKEQGVTIPDDVLTGAGDEIIAMIFEIAQAAGVIEEPTADDAFTATTQALTLWRERHPEMVDAEQEKRDFANVSPDQIKKIVGRMGA